MTTTLAEMGDLQTEEQFLQAVLEYARWHKWLAYHTRDSRRSASGFPDVIAVRGARIVAAELKVKRGRLSAAQAEWLGALKSTTKVETYAWWPADWEQIERVMA
jgi:hypothetical protein